MAGSPVAHAKEHPLRRLLAVLVLAAAMLPALGAVASANPVPQCVPVPDLDGHIWYVCPR